ncbi:lytic transglycosylase domain-containing protein [Lysobacter sp. A6]|uniref:Lytic transglycosylase domain-containing protein n=1 Tax=Noviluteimonas lactosilytica TaxID=2888523 RepID=A0ABS8JGT8_9GAMM|nr:lytic transglycosylase domain-containing protein [Lysobacter lactosilyticus]MCC8362817.1 lytic transglycosylase domain-containing protein [Lysobacter lactosilyticus]
MFARLAIAGLLCLLPLAGAQARTVYECLRDNRLSLSTAPEPGSKCKPKRVNDRKAKVKNFWGDQGPVRGNLYTTRIDGKQVYSTRNIKGWKEVAEPVKVRAPRDSWAHEGLGELGAPRLDVFAVQFRAAAKKTGVEDAWLRAIAHAESDFNPRALSPKGAQGVMQLMPALARAYGVADPYQSAQCIDGAARHIRDLMRRYKGDLVLVAAAYNAGTGAVDRYGGVPPYAETEDYVDKVQTLYASYRAALQPKRSGKG